MKNNFFKKDTPVSVIQKKMKHEGPSEAVREKFTEKREAEYSKIEKQNIKYLDRLVRNLQRKIQVLGLELDSEDNERLTRYAEELRKLKNPHHTTDPRHNRKSQKEIPLITTITNGTKNKDLQNSYLQSKPQIQTLSGSNISGKNNEYATRVITADSGIRIPRSIDLYNKKERYKHRDLKLMNYKERERVNNVKKNNPLEQFSTKHAQSVWREIHEKVLKAHEHFNNDIPFEPENFS